MAMLSALAAWLGCCAMVAGLEIANPYAGVDWQEAKRLKVNLHTHTSRSDGKLEPAAVVDAYRAQNYAALAITDHNLATWPWTDFGRDPAAVGMLAIGGNEFSDGHHRNALFAAVAEDPGADVARSAQLVAAAGGLLQLNHPGRYDKPPEWYVELIRKHDVIVALEVFNQGDRYPKDRQLWDAILALSMPQRPLWGTANDDMHKKKHMFRNYNIVLAEDGTNTALRAALVAGRSWFSYEPDGSGAAEAPRIEAIAIDDAVITITAPETEITWIANGKRVAGGATVDVATLVGAGLVGGYIRARLANDDGVTCTQPFGVRRDAER